MTFALVFDSCHTSPQYLITLVQYYVVATEVMTNDPLEGCVDICQIFKCPAIIINKVYDLLSWFSSDKDNAAWSCQVNPFLDPSHQRLKQSKKILSKESIQGSDKAHLFEGKSERCTKKMAILVFTSQIIFLSKRN